MIKSELVAKLAAEYPSLSESDVKRAVASIFDAITKQLEEGGRVELRGFGVFSVRAYDGRMGRNPRTGEPVSVPAKAVPFFKLGKELQERLNAE